MTNEQREAIDKLEKLVILRKNKNTIKYDNCICSTSDLNTVLSLIKQLEREKEIHVKLEQQYKKEYLDMSELNQKLRKQIDLMADTLSAICTGLSSIREQFEKSYCEFINSDEDCCWKTDMTCKDCIKQYFERKVEDVK